MCPVRCVTYVSGRSFRPSRAASTSKCNVVLTTARQARTELLNPRAPAEGYFDRDCRPPRAQAAPYTNMPMGLRLLPDVQAGTGTLSFADSQKSHN
jgi:hypothetical protein